MPKTNDTLTKPEERYPELAGEKNFTLAATKHKEPSQEREDEAFAVMGETLPGRDKRHLQTIGAERLISQAIEKGDVRIAERVLAMRRELKAEWAKEQYDIAMAGFQSECPVIKKLNEAKDNGRLLYRYASIESIVQEVKPLLEKYLFSYSFSMELKEGGVQTTCHITHAAGHSENSLMEVPFGKKTGIMSDTQVVAAAQTFAKRYAFCNAFGILTGDEDNDAQEPPQKSPVATHGEQGTTKPAQLVSSTPKPQKSDKEHIALYLEKLGIDWKDAEVAKGAILSITQLEPEEKNFPEIVARLSVRVQEQREAKAQSDNLLEKLKSFQ